MLEGRSSRVGGFTDVQCEGKVEDFLSLGGAGVGGGGSWGGGSFHGLFFLLDRLLSGWSLVMVFIHQRSLTWVIFYQGDFSSVRSFIR